MTITKELSEKEAVSLILSSNKRAVWRTCPYDKARDDCNCRCYKFFTRWERFRFIINFKCCPCKIFPDGKVKKRTWNWINSKDDEGCKK